MSDLQKARRLLDSGAYTCVLCRNDSLHTADRRGIAPLLSFIDSGIDCRGYAAADVVVGKAAALLFVLMGITAVSTPVMSAEAKRVLTEAGVTVEANEIVPHIISRDGRGICPMEQTVLGVEDPQEAPALLKRKVAQLRGEKKAGKLGFGLMRLPTLPGTEDIDLPAVCRMADAFLSEGYSYFDTAYMYHHGKSEEALREAVVRRHPRDSFTVADKMPIMMLKEPADIPRIFEEQLQKCGVDYFDYYLLHSLTAGHVKTAEDFGAFTYLQKKKAEGKIRRLGFSFHDSAAVLDDILKNHPDMEFVQLQVNYLDWDSPSTQSRACCEVARKHGKPIIVMEPVRGGALAKLPEAAMALLQAQRQEASAASWAIRFAATLPGVMTVLSGMSDENQLADNMAVAKEPAMPLCERELLFRVAEIVKSTPAIACTGCDYCRAVCPAGINIAALFENHNGRTAASLRGEDTRAFRAKYQEICSEAAPASACLTCRACEEVCPQHLPIPAHLEKIAQRFER